LELEDMPLFVEPSFEFPRGSGLHWAKQCVMASWMTSPSPDFMAGSKQFSMHFVESFDWLQAAVPGRATSTTSMTSMGREFFIFTSLVHEILWVGLVENFPANLFLGTQGSSF